MSSNDIARLRRLPPYLYVSDLLSGRRVLEIGCGDGTSAQFLLGCGAASVLAVDRSPELIGSARTRFRHENLEFRTMDYAALELEDASFDVVCVPGGGELLRWLGFLEEVRRVLAPTGHLVITERSADRTDVRADLRSDARGGVAYYEVLDRLEPLFGTARMVGITPFVGFSLVEYAPKEVEVAELELDTSLLARAATPDAVVEYLAVAGPLEGPPRGFLVVQLPAGDGIPIVAAAQNGADPTSLLGIARDEGGERASATPGGGRQDLDQTIPIATAWSRRRPALADEDAAAEIADLGERLREAEAQIEEAARLEEEGAARERDAERALDHAATTMTERDAVIAQLRDELAVTRAQNAAQGTEVAARVADLEASLADRTAATEKAAVRWKEAEAKSDELWRKIGEMQKELEAQREQGVESARAQRQAAQVALTRAMDEAAKKLVSVKDESIRTERERQALEKVVGSLRLEVTRLSGALEAARGEIEEGAAARERLVRELDDARVTRIDDAEPRVGLSALDELVAYLEAGLREEELRLGMIEERLRVVQGHIGMLPELPDGEAASGDVESGDGRENAIRAREAMIRALTSEVDQRDAKLAAMHEAVAAAGRQVADMAQMIQRTREQVLGSSAMEVALMLDQLAREAAEMAAAPASSETP